MIGDRYAERIRAPELVWRARRKICRANSYQQLVRYVFKRTANENNKQQNLKQERHRVENKKSRLNKQHR